MEYYIDFTLEQFSFETLCSRSKYFAAHFNWPDLNLDTNIVLIPTEFHDLHYMNLISLLSDSNMKIDTLIDFLDYIISLDDGNLCNIFTFADYFQVDLIFENLCTLLISTMPEKIPNYLYLLLVHYGEFHPVLLSCTEKVASSLHQNSLPPNFNILSSMRSRLSEDDIINHYAVRTDPDNLIVREQLRWSTFRFRQLIRKQLRTRRHLNRTKKMVCMVCSKEGRYIEIDSGNYIYHMAYRAPCCGNFMHKYCAINRYNYWFYCFKCTSILIEGEIIDENEPHFVTSRRNAQRHQNSIPVTTVLPRIPKLKQSYNIQRNDQTNNARPTAH